MFSGEKNLIEMFSDVWWSFNLQYKALRGNSFDKKDSSSI